MYLKYLEIVGFKSFAEKTRLEFEPGMTSIVGPNGCGKSNVSDSIRWVLGEQSAKALRGGKMEDVIFNGTDNAKPMGMAEVSLTLSDCEAVLGTEYNEVTITRRVFRSGEGQYFINKAPCRLKDIQRLFMDTGIGTNSYSIMEQGKIDRILSSHPEDRRAVFEEASGITKYKSDKKVAMRKLDQTEANLIRLDDIIREVKRQIGSLQRQAGKARRYSAIRDQLRDIELFFTRDRLKALDEQIKSLESRIATINEQDEAVRQDIEKEEGVSAEMREQIDAVEQEINHLVEKGIQTKAELNRLHDLIKTNEERITELQQLSDRDSRNAEESRMRLEQHTASLNEEKQRLEKTIGERDRMEKELAEFVQRLQEDESRLQETQRQLNALRSEQIDIESSQANLQNELSQIDAEERQNDIRRERLAAELSESTRALEAFDSRQAEMETRLSGLNEQVAQAAAKMEAAETSKSDKASAIAECREQLSAQQSLAAAITAQVKLLNESRADQEGFPEGARKILEKDPAIPYADADVIGPLAEQLKADDGYQRVLETVMRPLLDAIVVRHDATIAYLVKAVEKEGFGSVRLVSLRGADHTVDLPAGADALISHLSYPDELAPLVQRLFGHVVVVDNADALPEASSGSIIYVSRNGGLIGTGQGECWDPENQATTPLARHHLLASWQEELEAIEKKKTQLTSQLESLRQEDGNVAAMIAECRTQLDQQRRELALAEGESQIVAQEAKQMAARTETITFELNALKSSNHSGDDRRSQIQTKIDQLRDRQTEIRSTISSLTEKMRDLEDARTNSQRDTTERRVQFSELKQNADHISSRIEQLGARVKELESVIDERTRGVSSCNERMANLSAGVESAKQKIAPIEAEIEATAASLDETRGRKDSLNQSFAEHGRALRAKRELLEDLHKKHGQNEVELAQQQMRKQNTIERVTGEYRITTDEIYRAKEPEWEDGERPAMDAIETTVAELRAKLESMGPVNLVAIEEHAELEERYAFLTAQQTDLINAKSQLTDMIKEINKTTTEMFAETFNKVNENFQGMFTQLFGGGSAKLVLIDEGDVLESGIEIIARPPGKKLQTVSLLSGGERTMTAVALLFSLYMVKPSPFCVLDELDAALDDANIGRFVKTVQGFVEKSQFIIITHNRQTIAASQAIYGVTMEKQGISKIISAKFADYEKKTDTPAARKAEAEASTT